MGKLTCLRLIIRKKSPFYQFGSEQLSARDQHRLAVTEDDYQAHLESGVEDAEFLINYMDDDEDLSESSGDYIYEDEYGCFNDDHGNDLGPQGESPENSNNTNDDEAEKGKILLISFIRVLYVLKVL